MPSVNGLQVRDEGAGPPILLIHGTGAHLGTWEAVIAPLARDHRVIAYDRRGYSGSGGPLHARKGYLAAHAADAAALLDQLGAAPAIVCGWSWGGIVAMALAAWHPDKVARLFLYEPPFHARKHMGWALFRGFVATMFLRFTGRKPAGAEAFFRTALAETDGNNAFDRLTPEMRQSLLANAEPVFRELESGTGEDLSVDEVARIRCPSTLLVGGKTAPFLAEASDRVAKLVPGIRVVREPGAGHAMVAEQPDRFVEILRDAMVG